MANEPNAPDSEKRGASGRLSSPSRAGAPARGRTPRATRSRTVIVETKRKRVISAPKDQPKKETKTTKTTVAAKKIAVKKTPPKAAAKTSDKPDEIKSLRHPEKKKNLRKEPSSGGVVLRPLTEREKQNRALALSQVKQQEKQERARAESEAQIAQVEKEKRQKEEEEASARIEALRLQRQREEEARQRAAIETVRHVDAEDDSVKKRAPAHRRPAERKRRQNKLTISNALEDSERRQSLSALRRRQRQRQNVEKSEKKRIVRDVVIPEKIRVSELAARMAERANEIIKFLLKQGIVAKGDDMLDADTAQLVAEEFGHRIKRMTEADVEEAIDDRQDEEKDLRPRPPVVTVMGHVDHGKTSLLDALRQSSIASKEAGGITQHIGAYQAIMPSGATITFIDTPGHAAFTAMRARGAQTTDIIVLVIAADDGVMPQTIESIHHAQAAKTPIIVALNKTDLPGADPDKIMQQLLQHDVICEAQGGDVLSIPISAKTGKGLDALGEAIALQADLLELKANPSRAAQGVILEARLDKGAGHVATALIQRGTLRRGDVFVAGQHAGRVRRMKGHDGGDLQQAGPSCPVWVVGLSGAVAAGDPFDCVENEARAREIAEYRQRKAIDAQNISHAPLSLDQMFAAQDKKQELSFIIKADVQGSADAVVHAVESIGSEDIAAKIIHAGVGEVSESDIALAETTGASIFMFNVKAGQAAQKAARAAKIGLRAFDVIYNLIDEIKIQLAQHLGPERREMILGHAEILQLFGVGKKNTAAGCRVDDGQIKKDAHLRIRRNDVIVYDGVIQSLRRFKDNVLSVDAGQECGMTFDNPPPLEPGDAIECFSVEYIERQID